MFGKILEDILNEGTPSTSDISDAIANRKKVKIRYNSGGNGEAEGDRVVDPYVYGLSRGGNHVLRVFQEYGDSTGKNPTFTPGWKTVRVDRIEDWEELEQTFDEAPSDKYGKYNPQGDRNMSVVIMKAELPDLTHDEKGNFIPAGERRLKSMNKGKVYSLSDLMDRYGKKKETSGPDLNADYWKDFEKRTSQDDRNASRRDARWQSSADSRRYARSQSANRELQDFDRENPAFVKGRIDPERLKGTSSVSLDDDFWNQAEKDIQDMERKNNRYGKENAARMDKAADTRNLHRSGSANRELKDIDDDY